MKVVPSVDKRLSRLSPVALPKFCPELYMITKFSLSLSPFLYICIDIEEKAYMMKYLAIKLCYKIK